MAHQPSQTSPPRWSIGDLPLRSPAALAILLRVLLISFTSLPTLLQDSHILSTPFNGWRYLKEGTHLYSLNANPYEPGLFHHSPLYLSLFTTLFPPPSTTSSSSSSSAWATLQHLWTFLPFVAADVASAWALGRIWRAKRRLMDGGVGVGTTGGGGGEQAEKEVGEIEGVGGEDKGLSGAGDDWGESVMALFLLNPYALLSTLARSTTSIDNALVLSAIACTCEGNLPPSMFFLALATHTSLYPILLLPFLIMLHVQSSSFPPSNSSPSSPPPPPSAGSLAARLGMDPRLLSTGGKAAVWFAGVWAALWVVCEGVMGGERWEKRVWFDLLAVSDLTPNVGLSWYFFTEMFDHFRPFFVGVFQMHLLVYVAPLCLRLHRQPLLATTIMTGVISTFKSYPSWGDATLWISLLLLFPELFSTLRHPLLTVCVHLYTFILLPLLHHLWLVAGTGNANFFYAATLVYGLGCGMGLVDLLGAGLKNEAGLKVLEEIGVGKVGESALEALEARGLHVVQFTSLD